MIVIFFFEDGTTRQEKKQLHKTKQRRKDKLTRKPPEMLTVEISTAPAPSHSAGVCGTSPGPSRYMPPTAVSPEMAFVTAMRGECRE